MRLVVEGKFEGSKKYFRKENNKNNQPKRKNYFSKLCKKIKKKSDK